MKSDNESHQNTFDPCGDTPPGGCSSCPNNSQCFPQEFARPFLDEARATTVVEAYVTFLLEDGEVFIMGLEEFLENSGYFDEDEFEGSW